MSVDAKTLFLATRPWSFTMTFSSVTLGALVAALAGYFNLVLYLLTFGGMLAFHAGTNLINDFYDVKHDVDRTGAPTTKYRPHPVAAGAESPATIRRWAALFYALALLAAGYLAILRSPVVLAIVAVGMVGSLLYTADPVVLKAKGLGEVTVFLMWGPLIPLGAFLVQTGMLSPLPVALALPIGLLVALVLLANNIRDIEYDGSVGMKTVPVLLGERRGILLYDALLSMTYLLVPIFVVLRLLPVWSLLVFLTLPESRGLWKMFRGQIPDNADPRTASLALKFALLYMASLVLQLFVPIAV
ncbi:MAG: prenyltransferase [Nitrososphaerota archaeon]|nr:prenyltransferase [Nitrososphaerota archaeon]